MKNNFDPLPHTISRGGVTLMGRGLLYVPVYVKKVFLVVPGHVLVAIFSRFLVVF